MSGPKHTATTLAGTPKDVALQFVDDVVADVARTVAQEAGQPWLIQFYTALATAVLCQTQGALGAEAAHLIGEAALRAAQKLRLTSDMGVH